MKILYFDCFSGISGDMTLGALIDLGIDTEVFKNELDKLNLKGYKIEIGKKIKCGIVGTDVDVILLDEHQHEHSHHHCGHEHAQTARNLLDIEKLIDSSSLKDRVKNFSKKVFREIAGAEARVHGKSIHEVHFHEVGAVDSIVDIVGAAICLDLLGVQAVYSSPLHDGQGFIECQHGLLPVPVPAVMEMLVGSGIPVITENVNTEMVTPTGIGIIKCLASAFGNMPSMTISGIGYGMGKRETGRLNALRVAMGTVMEKDSFSDEIAVLETNIDDISPEVLGYVFEKLFANGALDVFYTPVYMKKNRPAAMLTVLADKQDEEKLVDIIFRETSTLGIRKRSSQRYCMKRETLKVRIEFGEVRVKTASLGDTVKYAPEYEDCREIANSTGIPIMNIYEMVREKCRGNDALQ